MIRLALLAVLALAGCPSAPEPAPAEPAPAAAPAPGDAVAEVCAKLELGEAAAGTYTYGAEGDHHVKAGFELPAGTKRLVARTTVSDPAWTVKLSTGTGTCPHRGVELAHATALGTAEVALAAGELEGAPATFAPGEPWFVHTGVAEPFPAEGATATYTLEVQACQ